MNSKFKQIVAIIGVVAIVTTLFPSKFMEPVSASGNPTVQPVRERASYPDGDYKNSNMRYAVGFVYEDIWSDSSGGNWSPDPPNKTGVTITNPYSFTFSGRTVKNANVTPFSAVSQRDNGLFYDSRGQNYFEFSPYVGSNPSIPTKSGVSGLNTSSVSLSVTMKGDLTSTETYDLRSKEGACGACSPNVNGYRYYFPVIFAFELNGRMEVHYKLTDGTNIDSDFKGQSTDMGSVPVSITPETNPKYDYVGYKKSTEGSPSGGSIVSGNPPTVVYDATYDIYYLNLYYEPKSTDGKIIIKHFDMAGNSLDGVAGLNNREQLLKENTPYSFTHDAPAAGSGYAYQGYKKSTSGSAPGDPLFAPPAEYNLGTYTKTDFPNTVYLYYFYDKPAAPTDGKVIIKHFDLNNNSLDGVAGLNDREQTLKEGTLYPFTHDSPTAGSGYTYAGYKKSTSGSAPSGTMVNADYNLGVYTRAAFPNPVQINYYYDINMAGKVNIRHMVRSGPTGTYTQQHEQIIPIASLPFSASYNSDPKYGVSKGSNLSYVSFSNTETTKMSQSVSLTPSLTAAYITFYYEMPVDFTGDFDVIDPKIPYKTTFKLHPKNFYLNGCTYLSHTWRFSRDGFDWTSSLQTSQSADMTFSFANYPSILGVGTQFVYLKITTSCGDSGWIGPKTLEMTGPANNHPPEFQIAFVSPSNPTKPITSITEGSVLDLVVIQDPTVPTPTDPDGDTITFDGFKFTEGDAWIQSIPSKGQNHYLQYVNIPMDVRGYHSITATMHDPFGAVATASTSITIVPPNPVPIINGPDKVVEGRPLSAPFTSDRSYSPIDGRTINHTRDEWTNVHDVYTTIGTEKITLDVYDSIGLKSLAPAQHTLTVLEDLPPIPQLEYTSPNIRNADVPFKDTSYSPDGDKLIINNVSYRYDSDNDGIYTDETLVPVTMNANKEFTFHPTRVGKYKFYVDLKEDWGKMANGVFDFEVINDAPSVNFDISSETKNPVPIIPIPLKGNALTSVGWNNSDFKTALKGSSWNYNTATGALVHSPTNYGRFSTSIAPTKNVSVVDLQPYGYYTEISSTYVSGADWDLGNGYFARNEITNDRGSETTRIYHRDNSGALTFVAIRDNVVRVIGLDSVNQLVYTMGHNNELPNTSIATYRISSFISPSGVPMSVSYQATINGNRVDYNPSLITDRYFPTAFGDVMYYKTYLGINYFSVEKKLFNWGEDTPTNTKSYGSMYSSTSNIFDYINSSNSVPDLKMRFHFYVPYSYYIFNPVTDSNEYGGEYPSMGNLRDDMLSNIYNLYPSYDGKYVVSSQGKVYKTSDQSRVFTLTGGTYAYDIYGVTPSNIVYGLNGTMLKGFSVNSDGSLTQKWSYTPASGTAITANLADNSAGLIILERSSVSNYTVSRIDLGTGKKTVIAALNPASYTGDGGASISLQDDGTMKVAFTASGWTAGKYRYNQTYLISSSENTSMNEALSSQNQLLNSSLHLKNIMINYKIKMNLGVGGNVFTGFSFGAQDNSNMYRVEQNAQKLQLVKVEGGHRTVIQSVPFSFKTYQTYQMKITTLDKKIKVYVDGVPMIDVFDDTFGDGQFGPFSEIPRTEFFNMSYSDLQDRSVTSKMQGVALVGQDMAYTITNDDAEKDPMIVDLTEWTYNKVKEKFLDAGDGKSGPSSFSGKIYQKPVMQLDKVGVYDVTYKTVDDPNPDYLYPSNAFSEYRKPSNKAVRTLIVHRPPVVDYDVGVNADRTVKWTDRSHDPDRYLSATNYSTEATGIDYLQTKGILEKKFYYITPSGDYVATKLVTPKEAGIYTVGLAVKDEYGAWSDFLEKTVTISSPPTPDEPPHAGFTVPTTGYRGAAVTINSTAWDKEDGARENLPHEYYLQNMASGNETMASASRTSWTKTFSTMGTFQLRQTVEDHLGQVDSVTHTIEIVNRLPVAQLYIPASTDQNNPTRFETLTPTFKWNYGDPDDDPETKFQVKVYRYGGVLEQDSGIKSGNLLLWTPSIELPEHVDMYVVVRVFDGYDWSDYSDPHFFFIETNRPPEGDFDWLPKPAYEGDPIRITQAVSDPDLDTLSVSYAVTDPDGALAGYDYTVAPSYTDKAGPQFIGLKVGTYKVRMTISDGKAAPVAVTKNIVVLPLSVAGEVRHTDLWDERRIASNRDAGGDADQPRAYNIFWAGERFLLGASTTDTVTDTDAVEVKASMNGRTVSLTSSNPSHTNWSGEMWDADFEKLPDGPLTFTFKAIYSNGTVKLTQVTVVIAGNVQQTVGVHRRQ